VAATSIVALQAPFSPQTSRPPPLSPAMSPQGMEGHIALNKLINDALPAKELGKRVIIESKRVMDQAKENQEPKKDPKREPVVNHVIREKVNLTKNHVRLKE